MVSSPDYEEVGNLLKSKDKLQIATVSKLEDVKPSKISQSPLHIYAEVSNNKKKQKPQPNMEGSRPINSAIICHQRSPSPEYAAVENTKESSGDLLVTRQEEKDLQHYYHSLDSQVTDAESHVSPESAIAESAKEYCK